MSEGKVWKRVFWARSFRERLLGLMFLSQWPDDYEALLYDRCTSVHTFFTFLSPDLVFLDQEGRVLKVVSKAPPWRFHIGPARTDCVAEIPAGEATRIGLRVGVVLRF